MTQNESDRITRLRDEGHTYAQISEMTGISINTLKSFFRRINQKAGSGVEDADRCRECGCVIREKTDSKIDITEMEAELEGLEKQRRQLSGAKDRLGQQMDRLDIADRLYEKKYQDMENRLYRLYDEIEAVEDSMEEVRVRMENVQQQKITRDNIYQFLLYFDRLYDRFTDLEKKQFLSSFVERVDIYEKEQPDGRVLRHIKFRFPIFFDGEEIQEN